MGAVLEENGFVSRREVNWYVEGIYSEVFYDIIFYRKPLYYMLNIIVPRSHFCLPLPAQVTSLDLAASR